MKKVNKDGILESDSTVYCYRNGEMIANYFRKALQKDPSIPENEVIFLLTVTQWLKYPFDLNHGAVGLENKLNKDLLISLHEKLVKHGRTIFGSRQSLQRWHHRLFLVTFQEKGACPYDKMTGGQKITYMMGVSYALKKICLDYIARQGIEAPT